MNSNTHDPNTAVGPSAPKVTTKELWKQFWADAYGKEVQTAATYSYTWLADQFGHICIGILANFLATLVSGFVLVKLGWRPKLEYDTGLWPGLVLAFAGVAIWEWCAYRSSVKQATGTFPLDTSLLRDNAIVATAYMALGVLLAFGFHLEAIPAIIISAVVVVVAIVLAPRWLRQKIIWQKASIPYLFRLADVTSAISDADAKTLQGLIDAGAPPRTKPCQVVVGGPIGSGRTPMAAGIGTEFAFKQHKVRYVGLDCLLEFAATVTAMQPLPDDSGPATICYWRWSQSQVVIIDGVGPIISANEPQSEANLARFKGLLDNDLKSIAGVLSQCHTVWVMGDLSPPPPSDKLAALLDDFAKAVARYCGNTNDPLVVELGPPPSRAAAKGALLGTMRGPPQIAKVKGVRRVSRSL